LLDETCADLAAAGVRAAISKRKTARVFDWLIATLSYQGIADAIASGRKPAAPSIEPYGHFETHSLRQLHRTKYSLPARQRGKTHNCD
jgi:hypothetical protein